MAVTPRNLQQAQELETLLAEEELSQEARQRLSLMIEQLRLGRMVDEAVPPNIRVDEPIPGHHKAADEARAASPTGDLPRTDIAPAPPPSELVATHEFAAAVPRSSVATFNPEVEAAAAEGVAHEQTMMAQGARRFHPQLPDVERAMPVDDTREEL
jgi:hypothetical protein